MSYQLGIDFGTTFTAAAVRRADGTAEPEVVPLGGRGGAVSSVLHLARDERVTVGEAAAGLAGIDPTRVVRALKRRVGGPGRRRPRRAPLGGRGPVGAVAALGRRPRRRARERPARPGSPWPTRPRGPRTPSSGSPPRSPGRTWASRSSPSRAPWPTRPARPRPATRSGSTTSAAAGSTRPCCAGRARRPAGSRYSAYPRRSPISVASTSTSWSGNTSGPRSPTTCHRSRGSGARAPGRRRRSAPRTRSSCGSGAAISAAPFGWTAPRSRG